MSHRTHASAPLQAHRHAAPDRVHPGPAVTSKWGESGRRADNERRFAGSYRTGQGMGREPVQGSAAGGRDAGKALPGKEKRPGPSLKRLRNRPWKARGKTALSSSINVKPYTRSRSVPGRQAPKELDQSIMRADAAGRRSRRPARASASRRATPASSTEGPC